MGKIASSVERNLLLIVPAILLIVVLIPANNFLLHLMFPHNGITGCLSGVSIPVSATITKTSGVVNTPVGIAEKLTADDGYVGLSDGSFVFDTAKDRKDRDDKKHAVSAYQHNDTADAAFSWDQAIKHDPSDAEAQIYREDFNILNSGSPYVTLVVGTQLTGDLFQGGRDVLQGAYVTQKEFNHNPQFLCGKSLRLLIANSGSGQQNGTLVAAQIVQAAHADKTIVGVMGWPSSAQSLNALRELTVAHIPMVSPTASSDLFLNILEHTSSPYFFRIAPFDKEQARYGGQYIESTLHAKNAALFEDPNDVYSKSLADDFSDYFVAGGHTILDIERYGRGQADLLANVKTALDHHPEMIYFSGYWDDASHLLVALAQLTAQPAYRQFAQLPVMGGDALYELGHYPESALPGVSRLHFTAFASPDEWHFLCSTGQKDTCAQPIFFTEYTQDFDPAHQYPPRTDGRNFPDADAILGYDATRVLLVAYKNAAIRVQNPTPEDIQQALLGITGKQAFMGVSGQISFDANGNPTNKPVLVFRVDPHSPSMQAVIVNVSQRFTKVVK